MEVRGVLRQGDAPLDPDRTIRRSSACGQVATTARQLPRSMSESLAVVAREVVDAADGRSAAEGGVGAVMVVPVNPGLQGAVAGGVGAVQPPIRPLLQQGPVEPLHLAVRLRPIGPGALVA